MRDRGNRPIEWESALIAYTHDQIIKREEGSLFRIPFSWPYSRSSSARTAPDEALLIIGAWLVEMIVLAVFTLDYTLGDIAPRVVCVNWIHFQAKRCHGKLSLSLQEENLRVHSCARIIESNYGLIIYQQKLILHILQFPPLPLSLIFLFFLRWINRNTSSANYSKKCCIYYFLKTKKK